MVDGRMVKVKCRWQGILKLMGKEKVERVETSLKVP
jgi:hypothetical protein